MYSFIKAYDKCIILGEVTCHKCNDCTEPKDNITVKCPLGIQTCQLTIIGINNVFFERLKKQNIHFFKGFDKNDVKIDRGCGPMNTSVHQCIGLRRDQTRQTVLNNEVMKDSQFENVSFVCGQSSDCIGKYSASTEIWDIFCPKKSLYLRCIAQYTEYRVHKNDTTTIFCNGTGTIFVFGKPDTSRILASADEYNTEYINTFLKNQTENGVRIAIPAYSKYFLDTSIAYASKFMDCKYGYINGEDTITCTCNSQLCNEMNQEDLSRYFSGTATGTKIGYIWLYVTLIFVKYV